MLSKKYNSYLLLLSILLLACSDKGTPSSQENIIASSYQIDPVYSFLKTDKTYELVFRAAGLKQGDAVRLVNETGTFNYQINFISSNTVSITLANEFDSDVYSWFFIRNNQTQKAGNVLINIKESGVLSERVVAHRSGASEAGLPDNSIASLKYAKSLGCYAAECDIYITKDDSVVVCHTENSSDAIYGGKIIYQSTYTELKQAQKLSNGENLPLLQDFLTELLNSGNMKLWIDVKSIGENTVANKTLSARAGIKAAKIIRQFKAEDRIEYIIGRKQTVDLVKDNVQGDWAIGYMNQDYTPQQFLNAGYDWANFPVETFLNKPEVINSYKDAGIRVSVWNADSYGQMDFFIKQKMYAICTNYPKMLIDMIKDK